MKDETYYRCLGVIDRINDEATSKFKSGYGFSKALGRNPSWWNVRYGAVTFPRLNNIVTYSELFDVSVEYLLTGKKRTKYIPCIVCCENLYNKYKSTKISVENCQKYAPIMFKVKRGCQVNLATLFEMENILKTPAYNLGFKEIL